MRRLSRALGQWLAAAALALAAAPAGACPSDVGIAAAVCQTEAAIAATGLDTGLLLQRLAAEGTAARIHLVTSGADDDAGRLLRLRDLQRRVPLIAPLDFHYVASGVGVRPDPWTGRPSRHDGVDLAGLVGAPVRAPAPGRVSAVGWDDTLGRMVEIDHGLGLRTRYAHLESVAVTHGQRVGFRDTLGTLGSSGRSTGRHLHYEVRLDGRPVDPERLFEAARQLVGG